MDPLSDHKFAKPASMEPIMDFDEDMMEDDDEWMAEVDVSRFARDVASIGFDYTPSGSDAPSTSMANLDGDERAFPKPAYSYSCLIALALKNSRTGQLTVSEIYAFMCEHFPYFKNAPSGWKNSVRHNLSLNKCFMKVEVEQPGQQGRKSCLWMIRPEKAAKMDLDIVRWREKDPMAIEEAMPRPQDLMAIQEGRQGVPKEDRSLRTIQIENAVSIVKNVVFARHGIVPKSESLSFPSSSSSSSLSSSTYSSVISVPLPPHSSISHLVPSPCAPTRTVLDLNDRVGMHERKRIPPLPSTTFPRLEGEEKEKPHVGRTIVPNILRRSQPIVSTVTLVPSQRLSIPQFSDLLPPEMVPKIEAAQPNKSMSTPKKEPPSSPLRDQLSPIRLAYSSYDVVHDALTNNSLLACALDQSPYKGPVTFPSDLRL